MMIDTKTILSTLAAGTAAFAFSVPVLADDAPHRQAPLADAEAEVDEAPEASAPESDEVDAKRPAYRDRDDAADADAEADADAPRDVVKVIKENQNLSTLVAAIQHAELTETLQQEGPYTILAPTNAAFRDLPAGTLSKLLKPENKAQLAELLKYHVIAGNVSAEQLAQQTSVQAASGQTLNVTSEDGTTMVNKSTVQDIDMPATNGTVHTIDTVLLPPNFMSSDEAAEDRDPAAKSERKPDSADGDMGSTGVDQGQTVKDPGSADEVDADAPANSDGGEDAGVADDGPEAPVGGTM